LGVYDKPRPFTDDTNDGQWHIETDEGAWTALCAISIILTNEQAPFGKDDTSLVLSARTTIFYFDQRLNS